jgi:deoxycytidylate deaminase
MYWTCSGCSPKFHAEQSAIRNAQKNGHDLHGADLYLWGHWWCCENCWEKMIDVGIKKVFLAEEAKMMFGEK